MKIDFENDFKLDDDFIKSNWVYADNVNAGNPLKTKDQVLKRLLQKEEGLLLTKLEQDQDPFEMFLNPRTELVPKYQIPDTEPVFVSLKVELLDNTEASTFFQILHRNQTNQRKPVFALDTYKGLINYRVLNEKGQYERFKVCDFKAGEYQFHITFIRNERIEIDVEMPNRNGLLLTRTGKNVFDTTSDYQFQYGVYLTNGDAGEQSILYKFLQIEDYDFNTILNWETPTPEPIEPIEPVINEFRVDREQVLSFEMNEQEIVVRFN